MREITPQLRAKIPDLIKILHSVQAIKGRDLAEALNVSERSLRLIVNYARKNISPLICSGDYGYKISTNIEGTMATIRRNRAHAFSEIEVCNKQERMLREEYAV